jgi:HEAT repeat protein
MDELTRGRIQRGEITERDLSRFSSLTNPELVNLLADPLAHNRTAAARLLGERGYTEAIPSLCERLANEKALYSRLAASDALAVMGEASLPGLIALLGKIGSNQHRAIPDEGFYKKSYPLPRDLAARVIIRMGEAALPYLEDVLRQGQREAVLEAVDAIGHIAFYTKNTRSETVLLDLFDRPSTDDLLRWKLTRAFQSFPSDQARELLEEIIQHNKNPVMRCEALRSLSLHRNGVSGCIRDVIGRDPNPAVRKTAGVFLK